MSIARAKTGRAARYVYIRVHTSSDEKESHENKLVSFNIVYYEYVQTDYRGLHKHLGKSTQGLDSAQSVN